jgi:hypothetical protein
MTEENKNRIIQFIRNEANNDTFINIDIDGAFIAMNEYFIPVFNIKKSDLTEAEFKEVVEVLKQYIRNNPNQFEMGDLVHENAN